MISIFNRSRDLITKLFLLLFVVATSACNESGRYERSNGDLGKKTLAIYLAPMHYDTLCNSIQDRLIYPKEDSSKHSVVDREIRLQFKYSGKFKEYMEHGTMNVEPWDSTVKIEKVNDSTFILKPHLVKEGSVISMFYEPVFDHPYYFTWFRDEESRTTEPGKNVRIFMRSYILD
ncbi:MAG: hypothetical protein HRT58_03685 [Crocinitomicaceae bacterium]|nr:hypothetical protein [Flavobacteriales bacterium]NQZ34735.1 hypothetical protein [Crocinitomicaceae bacterium]